MSAKSLAAVITTSFIIAAGCGKQESAETSGHPANQDRVQTVSSSDGWIELSADPALSAWTLPSPGAWKLTYGVMEKSEGGGYIWTKERFGDFILDCEFKISEGGNSGISSVPITSRIPFRQVSRCRCTMCRAIPNRSRTTAAPSMTCSPRVSMPTNPPVNGIMLS